MNWIFRLPATLLLGVTLILGGCVQQDNSSDCTGRQGNIAIAKKMYETLLNGDMEGAFALMTDDISWTYHGGEGVIPFAGVYIGHEGVGRFFTKYGEVAEPLGMQLDRFSCAGSTVFVTGIESARIIATGKTYAAPWVHVIKIENGKIVNYEEYIDSALVAAAFD